MDGPFGLAFYGGVKLLAYAGWCWFGLTRAGFPAVGLLRRAFWMGFVRWLLGLGLGVIIFFAFHPTKDQVLAQYVAVYVPVRVLEWGLLGLWLLPRGLRWPRPLLVAWVLGGVLVSFLTDMTSPQMIERGRFCVGRCLC